MKKLKALIVEDCEDDALLLQRHLSNEGFSVESSVAKTRGEFETALKESEWDIVLCDYSMPSFNAIDALEALKKSGLDVPLIVISGTVGEESAVEAMVRGASDYLLKSNLKRLAQAIEREIKEAKNRQARHLAEALLVKSENDRQRLSETQSLILDALPVEICLLDGDGDVISINAAWEKFARDNNYYGDNFGVGVNYLEVCDNAVGAFSEGASEIAAGIRKILSGESKHFDVEYPCRVCKGEQWFRLMVAPIRAETSTGAVVMHINVTERKLAESNLRKTEAKYRNIIEALPAIIYLMEPTPPYAPIYFSPNIEIFGYSAEEWYKQPDLWASLIHEEDRERALKIAAQAKERDEEIELEYRMVGRDNKIYWMHDKGRFITDEEGNRINWHGVMMDVTKTKELEEQLRQAQKLESVGRLAGGVAHDFNNMLTAIKGYSDLTLRHLEKDSPLRGNILEIKKAGERSALLTYQLLAFSRQQILHPVVLDINEAITDTIKILQRLIGEDIQLITILGAHIGKVKVDAGQLSQIIMNLAVNARDAMPRGGKMVVETGNVILTDSDPERHTGSLPGPYVMLSVSDTGVGMNAATREKIFEPFFTTKEVGQGTGLGLSTVYGIVRQSGGNITVHSEESVGTTFKIYLPQVNEDAVKEKAKSVSSELLAGDESILLVEDEEMVRNLIRDILESCGYKITEARDGLEALQVCEKGDCKFDLLVTDVVMPKMGGRELAEKLSQKLPGLEVLFTSGYTDDAIVRHGVSASHVNFLQKPFTPTELAKKIRELLDKNKNKNSA